MTTTVDDAFNQFVTQRKKKLRGIAWKTAGEQQYEDVVQEAWLMARTVSADDGGPLDVWDEAHQQWLLAYLDHRLVRYTEQICLWHPLCSPMDHWRPPTSACCATSTTEWMPPLIIFVFRCLTPIAAARRRAVWLRVSNTSPSQAQTSCPSPGVVIGSGGKRSN
ncbi:hypothetical protein [Pseudorhodoferax sp. Leaf274]|uniref:hypothetical protein n=1 Tax=Pseudorhodoferax sp. Leaf274 TaxID=1736318 RepID=UPI0012E1885D|nr:hypothetical protein [Pseudorhodoferax sp. Leaf274]